MSHFDNFSFLFRCISEYISVQVLKCMDVENVITFSLMFRHIITTWEEDMVRYLTLYETINIINSLLIQGLDTDNAKKIAVIVEPNGSKSFELEKKTDHLMVDLLLCSCQTVCVWTMWKRFQGKKLVASSFSSSFG